MYIAYVADIFEKYPKAIPKEVSVPFEEALLNVCGTVQGVESALERSLTHVFEPGACSAMGKMKAKLNQFGRANEFSDKLKDLQAKINDGINHVHDLIGMLCNSLKVDEIKTYVSSKFDALQSALDNVATAQQVDKNHTILASKIGEVKSEVGEVKSTVLKMTVNAPEVTVHHSSILLPVLLLHWTSTPRTKKGNPPLQKGS